VLQLNEAAANIPAESAIVFNDTILILLQIKSVIYKCFVVITI
jgi:hypothetical protein